MTIMRQILVILIISLVGEFVSSLLPFPIPAGIYGFIIMFICLMTGILKVSQIREVSTFLVDNLQIIILPACMEIVSYWSEIAGEAWKLFSIAIISTCVVILVTGKTADFIITLKERRKA